MFRECVASKRKTGDGSGSMPPQKIQKVAPPSQGRKTEGPTTLPPLTPSSLPPSASLTPTHQPSSSELFRAVRALGKGPLEDIGRDASTLQSLDSYPRLSVEVVLKRGLTQLMKVSIFPRDTLLLVFLLVLTFCLPCSHLSPLVTLSSKS